VSVIAARRSELAVCESLSVVYGDGDAEVRALDDVELTIGEGETLALWGPSGSGKTTLLQVLGGLLLPDSGRVSWHGKPLSSLDAEARARARAGGIAYVFQGANLLAHFDACENVAFAAWASARDGTWQLEPGELLEMVGLGAKREALPSELSGGEAQRAALARALAQSPEMLLCDEPTGNLDSDTGRRVLDLIDEVQSRFGFALVTATHDRGVASRYERTIGLRDGRIVDPEGVG
jgi:ABC-type lipoprotein export system ATPase subunit